MNFPGVWVNASTSLVYRVVPKCACSTIGQILYYGDHGRFFEGDIHDARDGIWKWNETSDRERARKVIFGTVRSGSALTFTCVRNPYARVLSCFLDKIVGIQRNGTRYRGDLAETISKYYDMEIGDHPDAEFDQIAAFRKFLLFVRDTIKFRHPMHPDIHWAPMSGHVSTLINNGGSFDLVFPTERFEAGMRSVLDRVTMAHPVDLQALPRFNKSEGHGPKRAHPIEDYFDDLAQHIVTDVYRKDFLGFRYPRQPGQGGPIKDLDATEINARLRR